MINFNKHVKIGIVGAGTMGAGIAQVAAQYGHSVFLFDLNNDATQKSVKSIQSGLMKLVEKGKITQKNCDEIIDRIQPTDDLKDLGVCGLVIEAIIEDLSIKKKLFNELEEIVKPTCFIGSNTSSLSIGSIAAGCKNPERIVGIHFFNPANILPLVELIPSVLADRNIINILYELMKEWGKIPVIAKDTPGFIVNKVARPFYGEALRIYEEGIADIPSIDLAVKSIGGFRMGPFELMDLIGNDVNYKVTETVFREFYFDGRYKPSITQKRYAEAGLLGKKSGRGFYDYSNTKSQQVPDINPTLSNVIFERILVMLINEAADTLFRNIATKEDIDLAVTKGVNYPKGLLRWADEFGIKNVNDKLDQLYNTYYEERYRVCPLIKRMAENNLKFYPENGDN